LAKFNNFWHATLKKKLDANIYWTLGAASRHTNAPISHTKPSPYSV